MLCMQALWLCWAKGLLISAVQRAGYNLWLFTQLYIADPLLSFALHCLRLGLL